MSASAGEQTFFEILPKVNQSSTAGYTGFLMNVVETATGTGTHKLVDLQVGGVSKFRVDNQGDLTVNGSVNATQYDAWVKASGVSVGASGIIMQDADLSHTITLKTPDVVSTSFTLPLPSGMGTNGQVLTTDSVQTYWSTVSGGGGSPGGSDTQIQFNDSSSFGGDADLVWNKTTNALTVNGSINATTKSFLINHPTKEGAKLQYASLEGPEHGVYVRGQTSDNIIELPEYWSELVDEDSITVHITPAKHLQPNIFVESWDNRKVVLSSDREIMVHYTIYGERKDVDKLKVEW
jgi:hypothetical protein